MTSYSGSSSGTASIVKASKVTAFALGLVTVSSVSSILANSRILRTSLIVLVAYDIGTTISVGQAGSTTLLLDPTENNPQVIDQYQEENYTSWGGSALPVLATITGSPAVGSSIVVVEYVETPSL